MRLKLERGCNLLDPTGRHDRRADCPPRTDVLRPHLAAHPRGRGVRNCAQCGADISHKRSDARFCGKPCQGHARRRARGVPPRPSGGICIVENCGRPWKSHRLCSRHDQQRRQGIGPKPVVAVRVCSVCDVDISARRSNAVTCSAPCKSKAADRRRNARPSAVLRKQARRARMLGNPGYVEVTAVEWRRIKRLFRGRCAYCDVRIERPTMDHVIPLARGGRHAPGNIVPACPTCNYSKSDFLLAEWRLRRVRG